MNTQKHILLHVSYLLKEEIEQLTAVQKEYLGTYLEKENKGINNFYEPTDKEWEELLKEISKESGEPQPDSSLYFFEYYYHKLGDMKAVFTGNGFDILSFPNQESDGSFFDFITHKQVIGDVMLGEDFLKLVKEGIITDYDGTLAHVYVDQYESTFGLCRMRKSDLPTFCQGEFMLSFKQWKKLCKNHIVEVEWCGR